MTPAHSRILVIEDDDAMRELLQDELADAGFDVEVAANGKLGVDAVRTRPFELVITDLRMPELDGFDVIRDIQAGLGTPHIVMITAFGSIDTAIKAVKLGAYDYITKPFAIEELLLVAQKALSDRGLRNEVQNLRNELSGRYSLGNLVATSPNMKEVLRVVQRVADSNVSALVVGESGTGKELIARAIHENSSRRSRPFVAINIAAIPDNLIESELFGHVRGAFTDAHRDRKGVFEEANGGSLFLDEIGELPLPSQAKLLRVLQEQEIRPVGSSTHRAVDVRIIAATNRDLESMRREGTFREDLYYRLNVIQIDIPPLRRRSEDILPLAERFLQVAAARHNRTRKLLLHGDSEAALLAYHWPGNVRELENVMERAVALCQGNEISAADLPDFVRQGRTNDFLDDAIARNWSLAELERQYIERVLRDEGGNKTRTAQRLGLDRKTLYRKLEEYSRDPEVVEADDE